jgi:hypothetical protein
MQWQSVLREIRAKKQQLARLNGGVGLPDMPPDGVSPGEIAAVERELGGPLPPSYRELLMVHDGVPNLYQGASLLAAHHLACGTFAELARSVIARSDPALAEGAGSGLSALLPFGMDPTMETIFAWDLAAPRRGSEAGVVVWMSEIGVQIESFPSFLGFILNLLEADVAERLRAPRRSTWRRGALVAQSPARGAALAAGPMAGDRAVFAA